MYVILSNVSNTSGHLSSIAWKKRKLHIAIAYKNVVKFRFAFENKSIELKRKRMAPRWKSGILVLLCVLFGVFPVMQLAFGAGFSNACPGSKSIYVYTIGGGIGEIAFLSIVFCLIYRLVFKLENCNCFISWLRYCKCGEQRWHTQTCFWWSFAIFTLFSGICFILGHYVYFGDKSTQNYNKYASNYCDGFLRGSVLFFIVASYVCACFFYVCFER